MRLILLSLLALAVAGCVAADPRYRSSEERLPDDVFQTLRADIDHPAQLKHDALAAIDADRVPSGLAEELTERVAAYAAEPTYFPRLEVRVWLARHASAAALSAPVPRASVDGPELLTNLWEVIGDAQTGAGRFPRVASEGQRVLNALMEADYEVGNGGFEQFVENDGAGGIRRAEAAATTVGAPEVARLLHEAAEARRAELAALDARWLRLEPSLTRRLRAYVLAHPRDFFSDAG
jgi:hypothetical protein